MLCFYCEIIEKGHTNPIKAVVIAHDGASAVERIRSRILTEREINQIPRSEEPTLEIEFYVAHEVTDVHLIPSD
jgi:hypothetical protein